MFTPGATRLAACATVVFTAAAVAGSLVTVRDWAASWPLLGFYTLLLINTFFSIRCFSSIAPRQAVAQIVTDCALVALYVYLAFQFANVTRFLWVSVVLFLVAIIRHALMLHAPGYVTLLTRKMLLNFLAAAGCGAALVGLAVGVPQSLVWWLGGFLLANIYILLMSKMYYPIADEARQQSEVTGFAAHDARLVPSKHQK
jgi:hypothetical protein